MASLRQIFVLRPTQPRSTKTAFGGAYPEGPGWILETRPRLEYHETAHLTRREDMLAFARRRCARSGGIIAILNQDGDVEQVWEWISAAEIEEDAPVDRFIERPADPQEHSSLRRI